MKQRAMRVSQELRKIVTQILFEDLSDPRLGFVTITHIEVTDDLRHARIYYSVLGDESTKEATAEALQEQASFIRRLVTERINMKFAMELHFAVDPSIDQSFKIDAIIKKIKDQESGKE